ncbi:MAG: Coenzyme F420 hydrogenase/dehydrogenase, beta subunit C-terminal domain [Deltaproteobacteria bacterium]|nr:Coenzyme F420 hydrogenase/dehydrogenase, beta subunit C-terminal domain [Deltaproteobacteria bacterium]
MTAKPHPKLCDYDACTGCGACQQVCPYNAIEMKLDDEGFQRPVILDSCIQCGLCSKVCPVLEKPNVERNSPPEAYVMWHNDETIRRVSASGGAFGVFADDVLERGGVVFGAAYNPDFTVSMHKAESKEQLEPLRGSKYVQSFTGDSYQQVKHLLSQGRPVLYAGLSCQVAGLYGYLGGDHEKLLTLDLACHGVPSVTVFQAYVQYMSQKLGSPVEAVNQRSPIDWSELIQYRVAIQTADGKTHYRTAQNDLFSNGFLSSVFLRPSCYQCPYRSLPRIADVTIGDFFGLGTIKPFNKDTRNGVSQILVNSEKGRQAVVANADQMFYEQRDLFECLAYNTSLWKPSSKNPRREAFFRDFQSQPFEALVKPYFGQSIKAKCLRFIRTMIKGCIGHRRSAKLYYYYRKSTGELEKLRARIAVPAEQQQGLKL